MKNYLNKLSIGQVIFIFGLIFFIQSTLPTAFLNLKVFSDFPTYYSAAVALKNNQDIYQHNVVTAIAVQQVEFGQDIGSYNYPPLLAQLFIPFSFLSYAAAKAIWTMILLLLLFLIGQELLKLPLGEKWKENCWPLMGVCLLAFPLNRVLVHGQLELLVLYGALLILRLYRNNKKIATGIIIGLLSIIKIYPLILLLYFLARLEKKIIVVAVATMFIIGGISLVIIPKTTSTTFFKHTVPALLHGKAAEQTINGQPSYGGTKYWPNNYALSGLFAHTLTKQAVTIGLVNKPNLATSLTYIFSVLVFLIMITMLYKTRKSPDPLAYFYILLTFLLIVPLAWEYYLCLALPALLILIHKQLQEPKKNRQLIILAVILAGLSLEIYYWRPWLLNGWGTIFMSAKTMGLIVLFIIATKHLAHQNEHTTS